MKFYGSVLEGETGSYEEATVDNSLPSISQDTQVDTISHTVENSLPTIEQYAGPPEFDYFYGNVLEAETPVADVDFDFNATAYVANRKDLPAELVVPYTLTTTITASKDTFVDRYYPTMNFSHMERLMVGDGRFRSLIGFDLNELPEDIRITNAYLDLTHKKKEGPLYIERIINDWEANSTTWSNQPGSEELDLTDMVKAWHDGTLDNHGLMLLSDEIHEYYSSEIPREDEKPQLHIEYTLPDGGQLSGVDDLESSIYVGERSDLESSMLVQGKNRPNQPATIEVVYGDNEDIESTIGVKRNTVADLKGSISVTQPEVRANIEIPERNNLDGQITVIQSKEEDVQAKLGVNRDELKSTIDVTHYDDFTANMTVRQSGSEDIQAKLSINRDWMESEIEIYERDNLSANIGVRVKEDTDFKATLEISRPYVDAKIAVPHHEDLPASLSVRQDDKSELQANMTLSRPNLIGGIEVFERDDLEANIQLRHAEEIAGRISVNRNWMESTLGIVIASSMESTITVRRDEVEDFPSSISVREDGTKDLTATITPRPLRISEIPILMDVYQKEDVVGRLYVNPAEHLECSITIKQFGLPGSIFVRFKLPRIWKKDASSYFKEE